MFSKKKKKPLISMPSNFEHRVHTGFDKREGRYVGLPLQWASIVGNNQILKSTNRPLPLVDPSEITPTEILDLKTIVRPHHNNNKADTHSLNSTGGSHTLGVANTADNNGGIVLPKTSHVARSNSLRSSSPPRMRRELRGNANVPPAVPEETSASNTPTPTQLSTTQMMTGNHPYALSGKPGPTPMGGGGAMPIGGGQSFTGHQMFTAAPQNGSAPLAVRTDLSAAGPTAAAGLQYRVGALGAQQQTSPAGSIASATRSTHSHISTSGSAQHPHLHGHAHTHHLNNNFTAGTAAPPQQTLYPTPQQQHQSLMHHAAIHQQQHQLPPPQHPPKPITSAMPPPSSDQNQNPHHSHFQGANSVKTNSRASSSSGGNSSLAHGSSSAGGSGTTPKQEQRLTHEQVCCNLKCYFLFLSRVVNLFFFFLTVSCCSANGCIRW